MEPGGQALTPSLIVAQKTVQPDEQLEPGPQTAAYAVPGVSANPTVSTASALPTTPARTRKPRREVRRESQPVTPSARRDVTVGCVVRPSADSASVVAVTTRPRPSSRSAAPPP